MDIIIKTKNLELTDSLNTLINKKMAGLKKFMPVAEDEIPVKGKTLLGVFLEIERESKHHRKGDVFNAEAIITLPGKKLVAKAHGENLVTIIGKVKHELEREVRKYKTQKIELPRRKYKKVKHEVTY